MSSTRWTFMLQQENKTHKGRLNWAMLCNTWVFYFANLHGFTQPPAWVPCFFKSTTSQRCDILYNSVIKYHTDRIWPKLLWKPYVEFDLYFNKSKKFAFHGPSVWMKTKVFIFCWFLLQEIYTLVSWANYFEVDFDLDVVFVFVFTFLFTLTQLAFGIIKKHTIWIAKEKGR